MRLYLKFILLRGVLLFFILVIGLTSCKNNDDSNTQPASSVLTGKINGKNWVYRDGAAGINIINRVTDSTTEYFTQLFLQDYPRVFQGCGVELPNRYVGEDECFYILFLHDDLLSNFSVDVNDTKNSVSLPNDSIYNAFYFFRHSYFDSLGNWSELNTGVGSGTFQITNVNLTDSILSGYLDVQDNENPNNFFLKGNFDVRIYKCD
jgi:hypothetical protein